MGVPSRTSAPTPALDQTSDIQIILGKVRPLSRPLTEAHPQVLIVARLDVLVTAILLDLIPDVDDYPASWERSCVGEAGIVELGRQRHPDWHTGPNMKPYLRVANVFEDRIDTRDVMEMHWLSETFERFKLRVGDVLLNEGQTPDLLGRPAIYRGEPPEVAFTNSLLRFVACDRVLPEFALLVFRRHMRAGRFKRESRITTNIAHLSASRLKPIEFPIPDLTEQSEIVESAKRNFDAVARQRDELIRSRARAKQLRRSLLNAAFSGRLIDSSSEVLEELESV
ncbi:restriction endonuclease subunit S [Mycobacterium sp. NAZ190054]|uniref:restriction endonuclease subunit S n=1 Tax=Mycobacterium sp. NAZ190054 TaxID=1747766 RepID=UPI0012E36C4C|nr:restriction endonuclease subunit S [Mycobacterium sp. NAZ190054]